MGSDAQFSFSESFPRFLAIMPAYVDVPPHPAHSEVRLTRAITDRWASVAIQHKNKSTLWKIFQGVHNSVRAVVVNPLRILPCAPNIHCISSVLGSIASRRVESGAVRFYVIWDRRPGFRPGCFGRFERVDFLGTIWHFISCCSRRGW